MTVDGSLYEQFVSDATLLALGRDATSSTNLPKQYHFSVWCVPHTSSISWPLHFTEETLPHLRPRKSTDPVNFYCVFNISHHPLGSIGKSSSPLKRERNLRLMTRIHSEKMDLEEKSQFKATWKETAHGQLLNVAFGRRQDALNPAKTEENKKTLR